MVDAIEAVVATMSKAGSEGGWLVGVGCALGGSVFLASSASITFSCIVGAEGRSRSLGVI